MDWNILDKKLRRTPLIKEVFALAPDAYLVGGYIRDIATGIKRPTDADFVMKGRVQVVAQEIARRHNGTVVVLGDEGLTRVVLKRKKTIDLSRYNGSIEDNLKSRDFTVNSIAWSPDTGIVDSCNGLRQIKRGIIRSYLKSNLQNDPLRMLRAYRFHAQFGWTLERNTRQFIRDNSSMLSSVASERIALELFKLLEGSYYISALRGAQREGILDQILSLNNNLLHHNIKLVSRLHALISGIYLKQIDKNGYQGLKRAEILKLSILLLGSKPDGYRLALSNKLSRHTSLISGLYERYRSLKSNDYDGMFQCFEEADDAAEDLLILSAKHSLMPELKRFERIQKHPLARATDIMAALGISAGGVPVGRALQDVKKNMFNRTLKTKSQTLKHLKHNIEKYT